MSARAKVKQAAKPAKKKNSKKLKSLKKKAQPTDVGKSALDGYLAADGKAVYASRPQESRGRLYDEAPSKTRGAFERDRDRIIHCAAFRRLKFKTQVFVYHEGDHYRTRLSHSIEVAQVARSLARLLHADEDLAETCALAHDLGHTPFAHVGEDALKECMEPYGGFDHNDQTLRVVTKLEKKYPDFDGLNLCWESLEGLVKHNGPVVKKGHKKPKLEITLSEISKQWDMMLGSYASLEAQAAGIADDIAYNSHDLDDGLQAGMFTLKDLEQVEWVDAIMRAKRKAHPDIDNYRLTQETIRDVMGTYVIDVLAESRANIIALDPKTPDDIRHAKHQLVTMSDEMKKKDRALRDFLWANFYRHHQVSRVRRKVFACVQDLFAVFMEHKRCLPAVVLKQVDAVPKGWKAETWRARAVADYIASMTDRLALLEHRDLFDAYQVMR
ncbi:MAG: deoxyguanosinetriphosphate triphosphohydrolase [Alphaproteobacteria bacterium]|nr:deoxyguanosinetriphosphate triphosphohydrolase [Alphaproteobacteria bacterium]